MQNNEEHVTGEIDILREEMRQLTLDNKRLTRALDLATKQIERNKRTFAAKDNVNRVISAKRSELERYMNLLLGNCPDMILLFDQEGRIAYCTDSFLKLCGISGFGMVQGQSCMELMAPYTDERFKARMGEVFSGVYRNNAPSVFNGTVDFSKNKNSRSYNIQVTPMLGEKGNAEGAMVIFTDTTEILRAQYDAERANAAKSSFLATVSHEIRTPMNAIIGVSNMLKSTALDTQQHEFLNNIQNASYVLLNLINDVLDFSKIEAAKMDLILEPFDLPGQLRHLQAMFELMFQQKGLGFSCRFDDDLPRVVLGDEKRISQILTNILNNALKYTREGEVQWRVSRRSGGGIEFVVSDTGVGIKEEAIPKLFNSFEQLDEVNNKGVVGTGLGLAISKSLCDLMDGEITVQSVYGEGSVFTIYLPLAEGASGDLVIGEQDNTTDFTAPEVKALLVDDIDINLAVAEFMLSHYEIKADLATSGAQAIELVRQNYYDIIFMDHMMPEMDGIEATKIIRSLGGYAGTVPIVALTANAVKSAVDNFYANGLNDFLPKPIDNEALAACILRILPKDKIQVG